MELHPDSFTDAMLDPTTGLTHAALVGLRKQSVSDAERLLSYHVASYMQRNGYQQEATYVQTVAAWHEATDGRGLTQLQRCRQNYHMLNYIVREWMPWYDDTPDFSLVDINR